MATIAPWESSDLPAPYAQVEREIEGKLRRFALWRWDERLVWRDLEHPRLWWATFDPASDLDDWERAIKNWQFGRAFSETCYFGGRGELVGFDRSVSFSSAHPGCHDFYVLVGASGSGVARWEQNAHWWKFDTAGYKRLRRQLRRNHSKFAGATVLAIPIWQSKFQPPNLRNALLEGFKPVFLRPLSPEVTRFLQLGQRAELFDTVKALATWRLRFVSLQVHQLHQFIPEINRRYPKVIPRLCEHFGLPTNLHFVLSTARTPNRQTLLCCLKAENTAWSIHSRLNEAATAHEQLELQLRLRDALKPILTSAEIEEILAPFARP